MATSRCWPAVTALARRRRRRRPAPAAAAARRRPLTNLAHLDFLGDRVTPAEAGRPHDVPARAGPSVGVLWTYADRNDDGSFERVGGGTYDPATDTYGQGAFNADDIARAAVVYLRDWGRPARPRAGARRTRCCAA